MGQHDIHIDRRAFARLRRSSTYRALAEAWDTPVLLACSGGADSVSLVAAASIAMAAGRVAPFLVVHVDHGTRPETPEEGRFVAALSASLGHPFVQLRPQDPAAQGSGAEAGLRDLRYQALARLTRRLRVETVVTAHTKDDQIETIVMRLIAGSSALASAGMRETQELETPSGQLRLLRPLLGVSRAELRGVLSDLGIPHREDPSNLDLDYRRNRVRQQVIPQLEAVDPGFGEGLIRSVKLAASDAAVVDRIADEAASKYVSDEVSEARVCREFLRSAETAIATRVMRAAAMRMLSGDVRELTYERVLAAVQAAGGRTGARIELPYGIVAIVEDDAVVICRKWESVDTDD